MKLYAKFHDMKKYLAIFKINLLNSLAYPAEVTTRSGMILIFMLVFFQLWQVTYRASGTQVLNGLTLHDTMWYLLMAETLELGRPRLARLISQQVKDGSIAYLLNKPYDFLLYQLAGGLGESLPRMGMLFILGGALVWSMAGAPPALQNWPLALVALAGAWLLHFCVNALIGLAAFVVEEVAPFEWIYQKLVFILGGMLIPLDFYPAWLQTLAKSLPFAYMMYGPARLFVHSDLLLFLQIAVGQLLWLAFIGGALTLAFARGMRRLAINGG
jgi:ABC-2 type transport system permease protein